MRKNKDMSYEEFEGPYNRPERSDRQYEEFEGAYDYEQDDTVEHYYGDFG